MEYESSAGVDSANAVEAESTVERNGLKCT